MKRRVLAVGLVAVLGLVGFRLWSGAGESSTAAAPEAGGSERMVRAAASESNAGLTPAHGEPPVTSPNLYRPPVRAGQVSRRSDPTPVRIAGMSPRESAEYVATLNKGGRLDASRERQRTFHQERRREKRAAKAAKRQSAERGGRSFRAKRRKAATGE